MTSLIIGNKNYSNKRIAKELKGLDLNTAIVSPLKFTLKISDVNGHDRCYYNKKRLFKKDIDAIIPRIGKHLLYGCAVVEHINKNMGIYSPSTAIGLQNAANKYLCTQILSKEKIQVPKTVYFQKPENYKFLINEVGGYPAVAKLLRGSQGAGVFIIDSDLSGSTALSTISRSHKVLLQEYIETSKTDERKSDIRAWVVGNKVVASMKRYSISKDFRSNYTISKTAEKIELTEDQKKMAVQAAKAVGLEFAGVDLMEDVKAGKTYCIEVNGNASLYGIEKVTKINVAKEIAKHIEYAITEGLFSFSYKSNKNLDFIDSEDKTDIEISFLEEPTEEEKENEFSVNAEYMEHPANQKAIELYSKNKNKGSKLNTWLSNIKGKSI